MLHLVRELPIRRWAAVSSEGLRYRQTLRMKIAWASIGIAFMVLGGLLSAGFVLILLRHGHFAATLGLLPGLAGIAVGFLLLTIFAYHVTADDRALNMTFVFRKASVPWGDVEYYRKLFAGWSLVANGPHIRGSVLTLISYRKPGPYGLVSATAVFFTEARTPAFSLNRRDYFTFLDHYVPNKYKRRNG